MASSRLATLQKSTIVRTFSLLERLAPGIGARWAEALWFSVPRSRSRRQESTRPGRRFQVHVQGGKVVGEVWGDGPVVYLQHGWGGWWGQLGALVDLLVEAGHRVVAFDAPSHGDSDPGQAGPGRGTILEFADALAAVVAAHGPAHAVVAHSLGATAAGFALQGGLPVGRLAFVAPMAGPLAYSHVLAERLGFGERIRTRLVGRVERRVGMSISAFDVPAMARQVATPPLLLVHDRLDAETGWSDSAAIAKAWPRARLVTTTGLGHRRILRDPAVVAEVVGFVAAPASGSAAPAPAAAGGTLRAR
jgi:pimeloyl-ACP methyl ester carboxylesterase